MELSYTMGMDRDGLGSICIHGRLLIYSVSPFPQLLLKYLSFATSLDEYSLMVQLKNTKSILLRPFAPSHVKDQHNELPFGFRAQ